MLNNKIKIMLLNLNEGNVINYINLLNNPKLTSNEVSTVINKVCSFSFSGDKVEVVRKCPNLTEDNINKIALSMNINNSSINDMVSFIVDCKKIPDISQKHLISEICKGNIDSLIISILTLHNLLNECVKMLSNKVIETDDVNLLIFCLTSKKFQSYSDILVKKIIEIGNSDDLYRCLCKSYYLEVFDTITILNRLYDMDAKFELKQLILLNEIDERFYDYIIGLFYQFSDLTFEDINGICTEHLSPEGRHALTELICNLGDAKNIDNYLSYNSNFDEYDIELLSKRLYELNAKEVLTDILHYEKLEAYYDDIFDLLSNMDNTLYDDIKNIDISSLNSTNFLKYTKILLKSANEKEIVRFAITYQDVLNNIITDFVNIVCKFNAPEYIYEFAYNITNISNDDMSKLVKRIIEINNIEYMYLFLKNISNISKKDRKNLKAKILESHEMKFILLVAVYIDVKLINKLFESKYKMYSFIVSSKLFDKNELGDISNELFLKKVYNKEKEDVNITKISNKTYKLINQNNLKPNKNSKKNKKDSK